MEEKRRYKRLQTNLIGRLRSVRTSVREAARIEATIKDLSLGGVYIETNSPFDRGTVIELDFSLPGAESVVHASGVVRWAKPQEGMGIEFLEVRTENKGSITRFIEESMLRRVKELAKTPEHRKLLKLHLEKVGEELDCSSVCSYLDIEPPVLAEMIVDLADLALFRADEDKVVFLECQDEKLIEVIRKLD